MDMLRARYIKGLVGIYWIYILEIRINKMGINSEQYSKSYTNLNLV